MTPIWMIPDGKSKYENRDDALREYMLAEYGRADEAWVKVESDRLDGVEGEKPLVSRFWSALTAIFAFNKHEM